MSTCFLALSSGSCPSRSTPVWCAARWVFLPFVLRLTTQLAASAPRQEGRRPSRRWLRRGSGRTARACRDLRPARRGRVTTYSQSPPCGKKPGVALTIAKIGPARRLSSKRAFSRAPFRRKLARARESAYVVRRHLVDETSAVHRPAKCPRETKRLSDRRYRLRDRCRVGNSMPRRGRAADGSAPTAIGGRNPGVDERRFAGPATGETKGPKPWPKRASTGAAAGCTMTGRSA